MPIRKGRIAKPSVGRETKTNSTAVSSANHGVRTAGRRAGAAGVHDEAKKYFVMKKAKIWKLLLEEEKNFENLVSRIRSLLDYYEIPVGKQDTGRTVLAEQDIYMKELLEPLNCIYIT